MPKKQNSFDLREQVIEYIQLANDQKTPSKVFKVSKSSVSRGWIRYKKEGRIGSTPRLGVRVK
ncbi:IS630 transposase-related protein [Holospora undulata]|uniref:IS630 transposase-related protein n=1 Tax=Holospora undulata TaxID=1169117 RepID=UPI000330C68B